MNQVIVYLVVLLTISSPVVFGAIDDIEDIEEDIGALEPTTSASTGASSSSTSTTSSTSITSPTITTSSTSSSTTPDPSSSTTSKPNGFDISNASNIFQGNNRPSSNGSNNAFQLPNLSNILQGNNTLRPSSGSNNAFQFPNPLQGFQNIGKIPSDLVQQAAKLSLQPTISHFQDILKSLIKEPNNDELISAVQRTIDSFKELVNDAPNLGKAENVARDIQMRNFIKQLSQPFEQLRNIFNLRM